MVQSAISNFGSFGITMSKRHTLIWIVTILLPSSASAEFLGKTAGWEVHRNEDSCGMVLDYEGPGSTLLLFIKKANGNLFLSATNYGWSAKERQSYDVTFNLNGMSYSGGNSIGTGSSGGTASFPLSLLTLRSILRLGVR